MAQRSCREYVANRFYNELFNAVAASLQDGSGKLRFSSRSVRSVDSAELSDIEVKQVYVNNRPDMQIAFDVLVEAEIEVSERNRREDRYDENTTWFMISSTGDLTKRLNDFAITEVCEYDSRGRQTNPLSDALVPIIGKEQLEDIAADFLRRYYPEALQKPMTVEPSTLTERMGLNVQLKHMLQEIQSKDTASEKIVGAKPLDKAYEAR